MSFQRKMSDWCMGLYIPKDADLSDPYLYPGKALSLSGFQKRLSFQRNTIL